MDVLRCWSHVLHRQATWRRFLLCCPGLLLPLVCTSLLIAQTPAPPLPVSGSPEPAEQSKPGRDVLAYLEERVRQNPKDAASWRLLGRARQEHGDLPGALTALQKAIELDQLSAAAYFDLGHLAKVMGDPTTALQALQQVQNLAPDSSYAIDAAQLIATLEADDGVVPAGYAVRTFDGSNLSGLTTDTEESLLKGWADDLEIRLDLGAQFNSNVSLAPSSRELSPSQPDGFQGNVSAMGRWFLVNTTDFRLGPTIDMDFTLNEGSLDRLNLQSYRPGFMTDGKVVLGEFTLKPRLAYSFDHDEFQGKTFGNQHTLTASLGNVWSNSHTSTLYYAFNLNNLANDGIAPLVTSQDGVSNSVGLLHDRIDRRSWFRLIRVGADYQNTDTTGANYRFQGCSLYSQAILVPVPKLHVTLRGGWVFRDYNDFTGTPSRNTHIFRAGAELRKYFEAGFSTALIAQYDDFDSKNSRFDSDRFLTGGVVTWEY